MKRNKIKLVVWDLDNTIWDGILAENDDVILKPSIAEIIKTLDERGILQSVSSKNDLNAVMDKLKAFGLWDYFIYQKIDWNPKSQNIKKIISEVNIAENAVAFIDDQAFELDEAKFLIKDILCIPASNYSDILQMEEMKPEFVTEDSKLRRQMYQSDILRNQAENEFGGTTDEFLSTLGMKLLLRPAQEDDLMRVSELTVRTHQLNSTGYTYSFDELKQFIADSSYMLLVADLTDVYGYYGKIGLLMVYCEEDKWIIKLLLTSCRVMSRGIGTVVLRLISNYAISKGKELYSEFLPNERNKIMASTYMMNKFIKVSSNDNAVQIYKCMQQEPFSIPSYYHIDVSFER